MTSRIHFDLSNTLGSTTPPKVKVIDQYEINTPPYITTTEVGQEEALASIRDLPEGRTLLGFSFDFNMHLMGQHAFSQVVLCDINARMHKLYQLTAELLELYDTKKTFRIAFENALIEESDYYFETKNISVFDKVTKRLLEADYSWLRTDETFARVRAHFTEKRITFKNLNILDQDGLQALGSFDVVYVSNIPEWIQRDRHYKRTHMEENLRKVIKEGTFFIDSKQIVEGEGMPSLRVTRGRLPSFRPSKKRKAIGQSARQRRFRALQLSPLKELNQSRLHCPEKPPLISPHLRDWEFHATPGSPADKETQGPETLPASLAERLSGFLTDPESLNV